MTDGAFKFHKMWRYVQLSEPYKVHFESCYGPEKILNFYAQILLKDWPFMHCQTSLTCLPVAEDLEVGEEHEEADGDVGVLDGEVDDVDGGHVGDAEAAVHHHQLVQELVSICPGSTWFTLWLEEEMQVSGSSLVTRVLVLVPGAPAAAGYSSPPGCRLLAG